MKKEPSALAVVAKPETQQVVQRETSPLSVTQVQAGLKAIHDVMRDCMNEGQDFGKIPGCGEKPGLFQPGAQKLSMMFQLNPEVREETISDYPSYHRGFRMIVRVTNGNKFADGVGECSTLESKYRYRSAKPKCPKCGEETIYKDKNGNGFYCWIKKGGCGETFPDNGSFEKGGKVEHDNPPDFWNTVRKMAFKRAFVHAIINATNTSELWSQDLEDLAANGVVQSTAKPRDVTPPKTEDEPERDSQGRTLEEATASEKKSWVSFIVPFGKHKGKKLGTLPPESLRWFVENFQVKKTYEQNGETKTTTAAQIAKDQLFRDALDEAQKTLSDNE